MSISLCMITRNEEKFLSRCLDSVKDHVHEIIIADTGSTDRTKEIAAKYTDKVFDFKWDGDFSAARNFSLSKATGEYILVLDADETIDKECLLKLKDYEGEGGVLITQRDYTDNPNKLGFRPIQGKYKGYVPMPVVRFFRNDPEFRFEGRVHETIDKSIKGREIVDQRDIFIHHFKEEKGNNRERQLEYMRIAKKIVAEDPNDGRAHYTIAAVSEIYLKDYVAALEHLAKAYDSGFNPGLALMGLGSLLFRLHKYEKSEEILLRAVSKGCRDPIVYYYLGLIYKKRNDPRAKKMLERFLRFDHPLKSKARNALESIEG